MTTVDDTELLARFEGLPVDRDNADHYRGRLARELRINRCQACGTWQEPPTASCPSCWSFDVVATPVSGSGTIYLAIFLHQGPPAEGVDYGIPYPVVTVQLDEGIRFTSTLIGAEGEQITIGSRVTLDWIERRGAPFPVFRLAQREAS